MPDSCISSTLAWKNVQQTPTVRCAWGRTSVQYVSYRSRGAIVLTSLSVWCVLLCARMGEADEEMMLSRRRSRGSGERTAGRTAAGRNTHAERRCGNRSALAEYHLLCKMCCIAPSCQGLEAGQRAIRHSTMSKAHTRSCGRFEVAQIRDWPLRSAGRGRGRCSC